MTSRAKKQARKKSKLGQTMKENIFEKLTDEELLALSSISMKKEEIREIITELGKESGEIDAFFKDELTMVDLVKLLDKNISRKQVVQLITSEDPGQEIKKIFK
ncbi:MAG: hypothetical protein AB1756_07460 [Acidobacteriota bacterium]